MTFQELDQILRGAKEGTRIAVNHFGYEIIGTVVWAGSWHQGEFHSERPLLILTDRGGYELIATQDHQGMPLLEVVILATQGDASRTSVSDFLTKVGMQHENDELLTPSFEEYQEKYSEGINGGK